MPRFALSAGLFAVAVATAAAAETRLMMFDQAGCHWCARWTADIGTEYPLTEEGTIAPLLRHRLRDPLPEGLTLDSPPRLTPTFVLVHDGREIGRIEGYPGEDFFWGLLDAMIDKLPPDTGAEDET